MDTGKRSRSGTNNGVNMWVWAAYSEKQQGWIWGCRKGKGWVVRKWNKGDWRAGKKGGKRSDFRLATFDRVVTEQKAQDLFLAFVSTSICVEYNFVDALRINDWLRTGGRKELPFFDLGRGICFPAGGSDEAIFHQKKKSISPSANAELQIITDDLFVLNGRSCSQPVATSASSSSSSSSSSSPSSSSSSSAPALIIQPHITEVNVAGSDIKNSDEVLDCQRLMNLYMVLRTVYLS